MGSSVIATVITKAPASHQFMFLYMLRLMMEPIRERMLSAQKISAKLTARKAMHMALRQALLVASFAPQIILIVSQNGRPGLA